MPPWILLAVGGGLVAGLLYTALLAGSLGGILFAYLSQLPLFLVGLSLGVLPAAVAGVTATALVTAAGGLMSAALFVTSSVLPLCLIVRQALLNRTDAQGRVVWYPPGLLVAWLSAMAAAAIVALGLLLAGHAEGIEGAVRSMLSSVLGPMTAPEPGQSEQVETLAAQLTRIFPGMVALSWIAMMAVNGCLAQGLLVGLKRNLRPSPRIAELVLPAWPLYALGASLLIAVVAGGGLGYIAGNLAIAFAVPFFFQGLGVVHALVNRLKARTLALFVFYLLLILWGVPAILVTIAGIAESFLGIRARFGRPHGPEEDD